MVGDFLFSKELLSELAVAEPDLDKIKSLVVASYNAENNANLDLSSNISDKELDKLVVWLNEIHAYHPRALLLSHKRQPVLLPLFSTTLSEKIFSVAQYNCPLCTDDDSFPILTIPIRISAISKQAIAKAPERRKAFERAIASRIEPYTGRYSRSEKLCVHIVFVLGKENRDKDLDNMSKAFLDALKGVLFGDDLDIDHLNLIKTKWNGLGDFIVLNIRKSSFNKHNDVLIKDFRHGWAGANFLNLEDFL